MTCHIIISGGFCAGKTSIINALTTDLGITKLSAHTTRQMRPGESPGIPYHFLDKETFDQNDRMGLYFDRIDFNGHSYAVLKNELHDRNVWLLDILSSSWNTYYSEVPDAIGIYLETPPEEELRRRALARGDTEEQIQRRLLALQKETREGFHHIIPADWSLQRKIEFVKDLVLSKKLPS